MQETHASVLAWAETAFGPVPSNFRVATRANEELAEALRALAANPESDAAAVEAADTIIVLARIAPAFGLEWGAFEVDARTVPAKFQDTALFFTYANRWMAELLFVLSMDDKHSDAGRLIGNIYNILQWAIRRWDLEPADVIAAKMVVNHGRTWAKQGDGNGFHIRQKTALQAATEAPPFARLAVRNATQLDAVGVPAGGLGKIKLAGTFMNVPLYVDETMPDDTFKIMQRRLKGPWGEVGNFGGLQDAGETAK